MNQELVDINFERIVYGNEWFIGFENGTPTVYMDPNISEANKEDLRIALKKEIETAKEKAKAGPRKTISMGEMKEAVSMVSIEDKGNAVHD